MLLRNIKWIGDEISIEMLDKEEKRQSFTFNVADALDVSGWLMQERERMLDVWRRQLEAMRRKENV